MKRFIPFIALLALVALVGCSGDSPSAKPVPTVVAETWNITTLSSSAAQAFVGSPVQIDIAVSKNGSPAPDGTTVELTSAGPGTLFGFTKGNLSPDKGSIQLSRDGEVVLKNGAATVFFVAATDPANPGGEAAGTYTVQARVKDAVRSIIVEYLPITAGETLVLTDINPDRGPYAGGQTVTIFGVNIEAPAEVFFILNGRPYQATVQSVVEGYDGWIVVTTPAFTGEDASIEQRADVRVAVAVGTEREQIGRLELAYTLLPASQTAGPVIFGLSPASGRSSGGEIVNVLGQGFGFPAANMAVEFISPSGGSRSATIVSVAPDGSQIQVETPRFSTLPLAEDQAQDVRVSTPNGSGQLDDGFLVLADNPTPVIATLSPTSGPLDGGTEVTIFGSGFQAPMQVFFGRLTALDVNVFNDTTPADQDRITCVTPDYSTQGDVPPVTVDVQVVNMSSGNEATRGGGFTYGDRLFISGNTPQEGNAGDLVVIYGSGFEDPLQVFFAGTQMDVVSVSGTEIVIRVPDDFNDECSPSSGSFRVVLLESDLEAEGGDFTIRGNAPTVLSVAPIVLQADLFGNLNPDAITITGRDFASDLLVQVGNFIAPSTSVTVLSSSSIDVQNLPSIDDLGINFATTSCILPGGEPGQRSTSTPINVTVTNFPGGCPDELRNAIIIEPSNSICTPTPAEIVTSPVGLGGTWSFAATAPGGCSPPQTLTLTNTGGETANNLVFLTSDPLRFPFVAPSDCSGSLPYNDSCVISMQFCPQFGDSGTLPGTLDIRYSDSTGTREPTIELSGPTAAP
jgi:hypothetical protein